MGAVHVPFFTVSLDNVFSAGVTTKTAQKHQEKYSLGLGFSKGMKLKASYSAQSWNSYDFAT